MITCLSRVALVLLVAACVPGFVMPAAAQTVPPLPTVESMPIHIGPVGLSPTVSITNVGRDTNVFNDPANPQSDFTATLLPRLGARMRARRFLFSYGSASDIVYFKKFSSERSVDSNIELRTDVDLGRLQPYVSASWVRTKQRLNAELDVRAPRAQRTLAGGVRLFMASRTAIVLNARRIDLTFDDGVFFRGVELARTLDARNDFVEAGLEMILTPLTTFTLATSLQQDRFPRTPERNADTLRILPTFQFDPTSLVRGTLAIGYRRFRPLSPDIPDYSGVLVQTTVGYTLLGRTKFDLNLIRDVQYSFEEQQPYYLTTGGRATITHQIFGAVDVQAVGGRQSMAYRAVGGAGQTRTDRSDVIGAGAGYHIRDTTRLGINWELVRRTSALDDRRFTSRRLFASITYGS